jgi:hypothetical protein
VREIVCVEERFEVFSGYYGLCTSCDWTANKQKVESMHIRVDKERNLKRKYVPKYDKTSQVDFSNLCNKFEECTPFETFQ